MGDYTRLDLDYSGHHKNLIQLLFIMGHFTTIFPPKRMTLIVLQFICFVRIPSMGKNRPLYEQIYPSSTICLSRMSGEISN